MFNPIIGMLHNLKEQRYHPIVFVESPLPGGPDTDKPVRHKSKMHHTTGFATRDEALVSTKGDLLERVKQIAVGEPRFCLQNDFPWDGEDTPALVVFFIEQNGEMVPAF